MATPRSRRSYMRPPWRSLDVLLLAFALACVHACIEAAPSASEIHATTHALELLPLKRRDVVVSIDSKTWTPSPPAEEEQVYGDTTVHPDVFLVIGVKSTVLRGFDARQAIRQTWANENATKPLGVRVVFLGCEPDLSMLGEHERSAAKGAIMEEKATYQDLLTDELQCHDSFYSLVDKVVAFLSYAHAVHPTLEYAMIADDDVYLRVDQLVALLKSDWIPKEGFYGGNSGEDKLRRPNAPIRDPKSRYYLPEEIYPIPELPPFVAGAQYVLSRDIVDFVALNRHELRGLKGLDDVTMAVWMLALQIHPVFLPEFQIVRTWECTNDIISYADLSPSAIRVVQSNLVEGRPFCSGYSPEMWLKTYRTIDFDADEDNGEEGDVSTSWEIELDPVLRALRITTTITVGTESVTLVYVPSAGPFMEIFCDRMLPLLEAKLSILVGRNFCRHQRRKLLEFVISHDVSMPRMRPLLALTRHNLERDRLDDELEHKSDSFVVALPSNTPRSTRLVIECLLATSNLEKHIVVVNEVELLNLTPDVVVVVTYVNGKRILEQFPDAIALVISSQPRTPTHPRQLHLPIASTAIGGSIRYSPMELLEASLARVADSRQRKFCANDHDCYNLASHQLLYYLINEVEAVEALGSCQSSSTRDRDPEEEPRPISSLTPTDDAVDAYRAFEFVLAFEDSDAAPGDIIEKIVATFLAGAIPVYSGQSTSVSSLFNPRAFVNCGSYESLHACASKVLHVHHSPALYDAMLREPPVINSTAFVETFSWHPDVADTEEARSQPTLSLSRRLQRLLLESSA